MGAISPLIVRRSVEIDFDRAGDEGWMANRRFEAMLSVLSLGFPSGEAFFVSSVRIHEAKICDPELLDRARRFVHQEAMHAKEHARFNRELLRQDRRGEISEILVRKFCAIVRRTTPKATQLAGTCAVEHVTAILAEWLLRRRKALAAASAPSLARLWLWHPPRSSNTSRFASTSIGVRSAQGRLPI